MCLVYDANLGDMYCISPRVRLTIDAMKLNDFTRLK